MATTITVKETTRRKLELLKEKKRARTFDEMLENIANKELKIPSSLAGAFPDLDTTNIRDHRDRTDRY